MRLDLNWINLTILSECLFRIEKKELYLKDYPDLAVLIQNYISDKIVELKIELEEL